MSIEEEIYKEYEKVKTDNLMDEVMALNAKNNFINYLKNCDINKELAKCNSYNNPVFIKMPFKYRFKRFINKLKNFILWN